MSIIRLIPSVKYQAIAAANALLLGHLQGILGQITLVFSYDASTDTTTAAYSGF